MTAQVNKVYLFCFLILLIQFRAISGCGPDETAYSDGSCRVMCYYDPPLRMLMDSCDKVCASYGKWLYQDNSCSNMCNSPMYQTYGPYDIALCNPPCFGDSYYDPGVQECVDSCTSPFVGTVGVNYNLCVDPAPAPDPDPTPDPTPDAPIDSDDPDKSSQVSYPTWTTTTADKADYVIEQIRGASLVAASISSLIDPAGILIGIPVKSFSYIKFQAIFYTDHLVYTLRTWNSTFVSAAASVKAPSKLDKDGTYRPVSDLYSYHGLHSMFLESYWYDLFALVITVSVFILLRFLEEVANKVPEQAMHDAMKTSRTLVQNLLLILIYNQFGSILFYAIIDYKTSTFKSTLSGISLLISIILLLVGCSLTAAHMRFLVKQQQLRRQNDFAELDKHYRKNENIQVLYRSCKRNKMYQQMFIFSYPIRDLLQNLVLGLLFSYPLAQATLMLVISLIIFIYLIVVRPLRHIFDQTRQILLEALVILSNLGVLVIANYDKDEEIKLTSRKQICDMIIVLHIAYNIVAIVSLIIKGIVSVYNAFAAKKKDRNASFYKNLQFAPSPTNNYAKKVTPIITNVNHSISPNLSISRANLMSAKGRASETIPIRSSETPISVTVASSPMQDLVQRRNVGRLDFPSSPTTIRTTRNVERKAYKNVTAALYS